MKSLTYNMAKLYIIESHSHKRLGDLDTARLKQDMAVRLAEQLGQNDEDYRLQFKGEYMQCLIDANARTLNEKLTAGFYDVQCPCGKHEKVVYASDEMLEQGIKPMSQYFKVLPSKQTGYRKVFGHYVPLRFICTTCSKVSSPRLTEHEIKLIEKGLVPVCSQGSASQSDIRFSENMHTALCNLSKELHIDMPALNELIDSYA